MTTLFDGYSKETANAQFYSRRQFVKTGLVELAFLAAAMAFPPVINAESAAAKKVTTVVSALAKALRLIGGPVCFTAADNLEANQSNSDSVHLHLRCAGLEASDAMVIAGALNSLPRTSYSELVSMSLSYNFTLGDAGAIAMAQSLPPTIRELGLVNCGIGDAGGEALLRWAEQANGLRILCIEENQISEGIKLRMVKLMHRKAELWIIV